ncbi:winged helix-turn-helix transcriptional regulator [Nocardioides taihuensis]|uniref:Winged helix-turn-helix transcriptional regulator n=1 Tax=Nocardioides taihuensis TaxID=1835606 RepID=A0ABW0BQE7_9ACTN
MGAPYHQFCPVSKAMELLDERWTLLVVRELLMGSERFNELRRGVPRMSPALLSRRLQQLTRAGVVDRLEDGTDVRYVLTEAGRELRPVVDALGTWGIRWIGELGEPDLDPKLLLWDMHRNVDSAAVPDRRTVVHFSFPDAARGEQEWWLVLTDGEADVCDDDPGHEVDASVTTSVAALTRVWRGDRTWTEALRDGSLEITGPEQVRRALPSWFRLSAFADVPRVEVAGGT